MGQRESHQGVAGFEDSHVDGHVRGRTRMRLNVHVIAAEELQGALAGQALDGVHVLAAPVIAPARIPFGVLVGKHAAHGPKHTPRDIVLAGNQFDAVRLPILFRADGIHHFLIKPFLRLALLRHGGSTPGLVALSMKRTNRTRPLSGTVQIHTGFGEPIAT